MWNYSTRKLLLFFVFKFIVLFFNLHQCNGYEYANNIFSCSTLQLNITRIKLKNQVTYFILTFLPDKRFWNLIIQNSTIYWCGVCVCSNCICSIYDTLMNVIEWIDFEKIQWRQKFNKIFATAEEQYN